MKKAIWKGQVLAKSDETVSVEGNAYFPPNSINEKFFEKSNTTTHCPWKGDAKYYHINVNGERNEDAAWYYPEVSELAKSIKGHVAFWNGVEIIED